MFPVLRLSTKSKFIWAEGPTFVDLRDISFKLHIYKFLFVNLKISQNYLLFTFTFDHLFSYETAFKTREILSQTTLFFKFN